MLDGYGADPGRLRDRVRLTGLLDTLPALLGMHPIAPAQVVEVGPNNRQDPGGLSGFVMIAESHISFHTFPARGFVTIDLYTCRDTMDRTRVVALLTEAFAIASVDIFRRTAAFAILWRISPPWNVPLSRPHLAGRRFNSKSAIPTRSERPLHDLLSMRRLVNKQVNGMCRLLHRR